MKAIIVAHLVLCLNVGAQSIEIERFQSELSQWESLTASKADMKALKSRHDELLESRFHVVARDVSKDAARAAIFRRS